MAKDVPRIPHETAMSGEETTDEYRDYFPA